MKAITIDSTSAGGRYADILEILSLMKDECGSAVNAAALCIRESERFRKAADSVQRRKPSVRRGRSAG